MKKEPASAANKSTPTKPADAKRTTGISAAASAKAKSKIEVKAEKVSANVKQPAAPSTPEKK